MEEEEIVCKNCGYSIEVAKMQNNQSSNKFLFIFGTIILVLCLIAILSTTNFQIGSNKESANQSNQRNLNVPQIEILEDYINIREKQAVSSNVLGQVHKGEIYDIINEYPETGYHWYEIKTSNGIHGYIAGQHEDTKYVKKLYVKKENTETTEADTTTPTETPVEQTTPSNNNSSSNQSSSSARCNESEKQRITNEYQTTLQQKTNEYNNNKARAEQQIATAKELMDINGGYLSYDEYQAKYNESQSDTYRQLLKVRYEASQTYDKMVNTYNQLDPTFQNWKDSYTAWYNEALRNINCA